MLYVSFAINSSKSKQNLYLEKKIVKAFKFFLFFEVKGLLGAYPFGGGSVRFGKSIRFGSEIVNSVFWIEFFQITN